MIKDDIPPFSLKGKKILLGISGSIAAYKAAILVRLFIKSGASVKAIMTPDAKNFISPLTISTLSKNQVFSSVSNEAEWNNHVELGLWADAMIVAPATANTLAKMANGLCDNMLTAVYLSARCPVFIAPAMDVDMWKHPASQNNIQTLKKNNAILIPVEHGELASGLVGEGRMAEPENILSFLKDYFSYEKKLEGKTILITAGPTVEAIDPVRYISNHSSGKMGIALAQACINRGAKVDLILGPVTATPPLHPNLKVHPVTTAEEMHDSALQHFTNADAAILAAAVADYRPKFKADQKIKKSGDTMSIELVKNPDIALALGIQKQDSQILVGFALETNNELENARQKRAKKNFDFIVLNSLQDQGAGFKHNTNKITILHKDNKVDNFELKTKKEVAEDIINGLIQYLLPVPQNSITTY